MRTLLSDIRFGTRTLVKSPGFALAAIVTLALGIGACTAIFSMVNALLIRPLPFHDPDRVLWVLGWDLRADSMRFNVSSADYADWRNERDVFEETACYRSWNANLTGLDVPERLQGYRVTPNIFALLGVEATLGRTFDAAAVAAGAERQLVLSHRLWQRRFDGDAAVIGRVLTINGSPYDVIGVMPAGFEFPQVNYRGDLWTTMPVEAAQFSDRSASYSVVALARMREDVSLVQAQARMDQVYRNLETDHPGTNTDLGVKLVPFREHMVRPMRSALLALLGAVGFLLLIACANVASLLLVRARGREREIAVRAALGASRWRLIRQLCTESVVLAVAACALGVIVAQWTLDAMLARVPHFFLRVMPGIADIGVDRTVLLFTVLVAAGTGIVFGAFPAISATRLNLTNALKDGVQGSIGRTRQRFRRFAVTAEIALSVLLLVGAGLLLRSYGNLTDVDPGFDAHNVISARVSLPATRYATNEDAIRIYDEMMRRIDRTPGVRSAGLINVMPFSTSNSSRSIEIQGAALDPDGPDRRADYRNASPAYFRTMGIRLIEGRPFTTFDRAEAAPVAIVNETFVRRHLEGRPAVGSRVRLRIGEDAPWLEIVGVVNDVHHHDLTTPVRSELYLPYMQAPRRSMTLVARTQGDPSSVMAAIRSEVAAIDSELPMFDVQTLDRAVAQSLFVQTITSSMMAGFALIALVLACVGLYGMMSFMTSQRTQEIGVRMAIGASGGDVLRLVLGDGLKMTAVGLVLGLLGALAVSRLVAALLFEVNPFDPVTFVVTALLLTAVMLAASYLPARRAARIDPMNALRYQ